MRWQGSTWVNKSEGQQKRNPQQRQLWKIVTRSSGASSAQVSLITTSRQRLSESSNGKRHIFFLMNCLMTKIHWYGARLRVNTSSYIYWNMKEKSYSLTRRSWSRVGSKPVEKPSRPRTELNLRCGDFLQIDSGPSRAELNWIQNWRYAKRDFLQTSFSLTKQYRRKADYRLTFSSKPQDGGFLWYTSWRPLQIQDSTEVRSVSGYQIKNAWGISQQCFII